MLTLRTIRHIADSRAIPSFRAGPSRSSCDHSSLADRGRRVQGQLRVASAEARRQWLHQQWQARQPR